MELDPSRPGQASSYLEHLPAVFRETAAPGDEPFLGRFLLAFEHLLTGLGNGAEPGLDELVDRVPQYLDPALTPDAFLDWLAGWVALTLRADLEAGVGDGSTAGGGGRQRARALIAGAIPLYRLRGTRAGLVQLVSLLTGGLAPTITEQAVPLQVGVASTIGVNTRIEGGPAHVFHVLLRLANPAPEARRRVEELVRAILDVEKPAHTRYQLDVLTPSMQIGVQSRIGVDTLLSPADTAGALP